MMGIARIEIDLQTMLCGNCNAPYAVVQGATQICPYCAADMIATDRIDWGKIRSKLKVEIARLKRSNASLRGVITKLKNKEVVYMTNVSGKTIFRGEPVKVVSKDDVDIADFSNYSYQEYQPGDKTGHCLIACDYRKINSAHSAHPCSECKLIGRIYYKLKPEYRHLIEQK